MTTMRTYTCTNCGASLATNAPPGTTINCEYCSTPFKVPPPSLDQPGDSQATVVAHFRPRGNPSSFAPTGPEGEPASTPEQPPAPDSPAGVGNTVDSDAGQPMVGRGDVIPPPDEPAGESAPAPISETLPEPPPAPSVEPEPHTPQIIEELDAPEAVVDSEHPLEPEPEPVPAVPPVVAEPTTPETIVVPEGVSAADIIAEPTKHGVAVPAEQGEPVLVAPNRVEIVPPQTPVAGGPPGAAMRSRNRTPMLIGGIVLVLCCLLATCAFMLSVIFPLLGNAGP